MTSVTEYRADLEALEDWDDYLLGHSGLPGPRGNLELARAAVELGDERRFRRYLAFTAEVAAVNDPHEFLAFVGVCGLGKLAAAGQTQILEELRLWANDPRWRTREAVAMALQRVGDEDPALLVQTANAWAHGTRFEQRAAVAGVAEPRLLTSRATAEAALDLLDRVTESLPGAGDRTTEGFIALRKALGYAWSVVLAAAPASGMPRFERWAQSRDPDVRWVVRENLKKARLKRLDSGWMTRLQAAVA